MEQQMLLATQQAAGAAQSAAEAAWWGIAMGAAVALLTLLALVATVRIATQTNIDRRRRDSALLWGLHTMLIKANKSAETIKLDDPEGCQSGCRSFITVLTNSKLAELYAATPLSSIPTRRAIQAFLDGKVCLAQIAHAVSDMAERPTEANKKHVRTAMQNLEARSNILGDEADRLLKVSLPERLLGH